MCPSAVDQPLSGGTPQCAASGNDSGSRDTQSRQLSISRAESFECTSGASHPAVGPSSAAIVSSRASEQRSDGTPHAVTQHDQLVPLLLHPVLASVEADFVGRRKLTGWQTPTAIHNRGWCMCINKGITKVRFHEMHLLTDFQAFRRPTPSATRCSHTCVSSRIAKILQPVSATISSVPNVKNLKR
jgi:hypothetical protein